MYDRHHPKIINFNAKYGENKVLKLQAVGQQKLLHDLICEYLERMLVNLEGALNLKILQTALNAKVSEQKEFDGLSFCPDQRVYELMLGESIWSIMNRTKANNVDIRQCWQSANQQDDIRQFTNSKSGSIDGAIIIFGADIEGCTVLPIEAKSTMINPLTSPEGNLEEQAVRCIKKKCDDFSKSTQISAIFILPNPFTEELEVDFQVIANQLQDTIPENSLGAICLLTIHENGLRLITCILYGKDFKLEILKIHDFMSTTNYIFPSTKN